MQLGTELRISKSNWTNSYRHEDEEDPNPPDVSMINGRPAEDWEQEGKMRALLAGREAARALVAMPRRDRS